MATMTEISRHSLGPPRSRAPGNTKSMAKFESYFISSGVLLVSPGRPQFINNLLTSNKNTNYAHKQSHIIHRYLHKLWHRAELLKRLRFGAVHIEFSTAPVHIIRGAQSRRS